MYASAMEATRHMEERVQAGFRYQIPPGAPGCGQVCALLAIYKPQGTLSS